MEEKYKNSTCKNLKLILEEYEKLKGQFVITSSWEIERLVGIGDDKEDWYYLTYDGRKLKWNSCVGRLMPLKGKLDDKDYNELIRIAKLNHYDQYDKIREQTIEELHKVNEKDEIVVGLYMELI
jgi:hypothetical protein